MKPNVIGSISIIFFYPLSSKSVFETANQFPVMYSVYRITTWTGACKTCDICFIY